MRSQNPFRQQRFDSGVKFITGQRAVSEFGAYVKELDSKGQSKYVELANKAYKAYADKK